LSLVLNFFLHRWPPLLRWGMHKSKRPILPPWLRSFMDDCLYLGVIKNVKTISVGLVEFSLETRVDFPVFNDPPSTVQHEVCSIDQDMSEYRYVMSHLAPLMLRAARMRL